MDQIAFSPFNMVHETELPAHARDLLYGADDAPTLLLIADGRSMAGPLAAAGGARLLGQVGLGDALARLDRVSQADLIVLECSSAPDAALPALLARLDRLASDGDAVLIVCCELASIDVVFGALQAEQAQLLCDPDPLDLAAAIALALQQRQASPLLGDIGRESEAARIEKLSAEVGRLARVLDRLTHAGTESAGLIRSALPEGPSLPRIADRASAYIGEAAPSASFLRPGSTLEPGQIRDLLRARRQRDQYFPADLFADPAWDMMLELMAARLAGERVSVSSLCIAAAVPPTTALRWIRQLTDRGFFQRQADPADGRRVFIALADDAAEAIARWFSTSRRILRDALG